MKFKIGFTAEKETEKKAPETETKAPEEAPARESLVRVYFPQRGFDCTYYNNLFDLHVGDLVYVDGKLEGKRGKASPQRTGERRKRRDVPLTLEKDDSGLGRDVYMRKIEAQLAEKGRAEGTKVPWGYAVAILKRQSGGVTKCFEHATVEQLRGVIAALTYDAKKKGRYSGAWGT